jgi:hypothetical protein
LLQLSQLAEPMLKFVKEVQREKPLEGTQAE